MSRKQYLFIQNNIYSIYSSHQKDEAEVSMPWMDQQRSGYNIIGKKDSISTFHTPRNTPYWYPVVQLMGQGMFHLHVI